jgi:hypothetical protein
LEVVTENSLRKRQRRDSEKRKYGFDLDTLYKLKNLTVIKTTAAAVVVSEHVASDFPGSSWPKNREQKPGKPA